ncbi:interleukin-17A-like [Engystomops pustulosus]|uniref:interleukin-17A-like n=1 Tax=Engystomops pustulosus TaxID=76066 RepID=UPI003AFB7955
MNPPRPRVLVPLLLLVFGFSYGKRCILPKELILTQNMKVNLNLLNMTLAHPTREDIRRSSLSPWTYRRDEDERRHPRVIYQAVCSHARCLDSRGNQDLSRDSTPISHNRLVLRWEVKDCEPHFRLENQWVTVGCTCTNTNNRPNISPGAPGPTMNP